MMMASADPATKEYAQVLQHSWNAAAGPLFCTLLKFRHNRDSPFSLIDKDVIRMIVLHVYPKPEPSADLLPVPLPFWFHRGSPEPSTSYFRRLIPFEYEGYFEPPLVVPQ